MAETHLGHPRLVISRAFTEADTNATTPAVQVPAKHFVPPYGVSVIVTEVLAGGTPSIDVGDGDDPDGWVDTLDVTETTAGAYSGSETNSPIAVKGKYYATADTIDVVASASLSDGTWYVAVLMYDLSNTL